MNRNPTIRRQVTIPISNNIMAEFFTFNNLSEPTKEHFALGLGDYQHSPLPLVRVHSECITGDLFGSRKCDCGPQLHDAIHRINKEGGFLIYLRQEGRGIGLYNKIDSYVLQENGLDTFTANNELGFEDDLRDYKVASEILTALGKINIALLSNNPQKEIQLTAYGINVVKVIDTIVSMTSHNKKYMEAKFSKTRHSL